MNGLSSDGSTIRDLPSSRGKLALRPKTEELGMKKLIGAATLLAVGGAAVWLVTGDSTVEPANLFPYDDPVAVAAGAALYAQNCASCHGAGLSGAEDWRTPNADGRLPAPPHDESGHTWHHPDIQLFMLTKYGPSELIGNGYESDMPGFDGVLSDEEIVQVLAYIKSTWPDRIISRHDEMNAAVAVQQQ